MRQHMNDMRQHDKHNQRQIPYLDAADADEGEVALDLLELVGVPERGVPLGVIPLAELVQGSQGVSFLRDRE